MRDHRRQDPPCPEAAHIRPVSPRYGAENRLNNGLLLRSDVHPMFDLAYLSVDTGYRLRVNSYPFSGY